MRPTKYVLDAQWKPVPTNDLERWARWFESDANRLIVSHKLRNGLNVSTIFLGLDHAHVGPPILYETAVFREDELLHIRRSATRDEALIVHQLIVDHAREGEWGGPPT